MDVTCATCGNTFQARRSSAKYCGKTCQKRSERQSKPAMQAAPDVPVVEFPALPVVEATKRELEAAGRLETALGQQALRLAKRMHSEFDTGSALASISRELRAVMAEALKGAAPVADPLDELAERRRRKAAGD